MIAKTDLARLKITLVMPEACDQHDVKPPVMRRIVVPIGIKLDRLHAVMQATMGWTNSHLWEFRARDTGWGPRDPDGGFGDGPLDARKATLLGVLEDMGVKTLTYLYDFGDGWEHKIKVERIFAGVPGLEVPFLLEASGRCPPEDIGGPWGYMEFLEAIADPDHERYDELTEWHDADFDPAAVDTPAIEKKLAALAKRWSPRNPKSPRKRS